MSTTIFDLSGQTALITGSSRGLGRAMAEGLGRAGARLLINGTTAETVQAAVEENARGRLQAEPLVFNVTDEAAVKAAFASLDARGIAVDILVNNAGIQFRKPMVELETADWQRVLDVNLTAAFVIGREAATTDDPARARQGHQYRLAHQRPRTRDDRALHGRKRRHQASHPGHGGGMGGSGIQANAIGPGYMITDMNEALIKNEAFNSWVVGRTPRAAGASPRS